MELENWNDLINSNTYAMNYYVVMVGSKYLTRGGIITSYSTLARTFLTAGAATTWANSNAPRGISWTVESLEA